MDLDIAINDRKGRIELIENYVKAENPIQKSKVVAEISIETGVTTEKAEEYIQNLIDAERIKENDNGDLIPVESD